MAAAQYFEQVQKIFIAFYQRPADPAGLKYWAQRVDAAGGDLTQVIDAFASSPEAVALYGAIDATTIGTVIDSLYLALFNKAPDAAGKQFYVDGFAAGTFTAGTIALAVLNGAQNDDLIAVQNKVQVANNFTQQVDGRPLSDAYFGTGTGFNVTYAGDTDAQAARDILKGVTFNAATVLNPSQVTEQLKAQIADATDPIQGQTGGQTFMLTTGVDNFVGGAGNDVFNATVTATSPVLGGLDKIDGAAGVDTLNIADTAVANNAAFALPAGFTMTNVEKLNVTTNGNVGDATGTAFDVSTVAGLTDFAGVAAGITLGSNVKAADTTNVSLTVAGNAAAKVAGGKAVAVVSDAAGTGTTDVIGKGLTSASVKGGGVVTIDNLGGAAGTTTSVGTTLTAVTLDAVAGNTAAVKGAAVDTVTVKNQKTALATTVTNGTSTALTVNVDAAGYDALGAVVAGVSVAAGAAATTINLNAVSKSNVAVSGAAAKTLNITGAGALTLSAAITTATKIDGSAATGALTLGVLNAATVNAKTGSGNDSLTLSATTKATVDTGAGNDSVTLASAVAAGSTINLGAGNDKLLVSTGSVDASTATAVTVIDGGDGIDTIAAALINAANAAQFKNFENIDVSSVTATPLDVELMTGSAITGLTLSGGTGGATVNNVAAGVGLTVSGVNDGTDATAGGTAGKTTIGIKGAAANTADMFAITFDGTAAPLATALLPTAVDADKIVVADVETISVSSAGTGFVANTLGLTADKLQTLTITGDKALTLSFDGVTGTNVAATGGAVKMIDGSAATGVLNINTANVVADNKAGVGLTVKTGSAKDVITLAQKATVDAGAGDDTIISSAAGGTFTGGAGNDKFDVALAVATGITEATAILTTITDLTAGDTIKLLAGNVGTTLGAKTALDATVTNLDQALAVTALTDTASEVSWFQYGANTYLVANDGTTGFTAGDLVVKITGLVDLSNSTLDTTTHYLTIV